MNWKTGSGHLLFWDSWSHHIINKIITDHHPVSLSLPCRSLTMIVFVNGSQAINRKKNVFAVYLDQSNLFQKFGGITMQCNCNNFIIYTKVFPLPVYFTRIDCKCHKLFGWKHRRMIFRRWLYWVSQGWMFKWSVIKGCPCEQVL